MTTRLLPREEWPRLAITEVGDLWSTMPDTTQVVVVEDEQGALVGCWVALPVVHVECLWIAEAHRKRGSVARRLWSAMRATVRRAFGASVVWTASIDAQVASLLEHAGAKPVAGQQWVLPIESGGVQSCRP